MKTKIKITIETDLYECDKSYKQEKNEQINDNIEILKGLFAKFGETLN